MKTEISLNWWRIRTADKCDLLCIFFGRNKNRNKAGWQLIFFPRHLRQKILHLCFFGNMLKVIEKICIKVIEKICIYVEVNHWQTWKQLNLCIASIVFISDHRQWTPRLNRFYSGQKIKPWNSNSRVWPMLHRQFVEKGNKWRIARWILPEASLSLILGTAAQAVDSFNKNSG